MAITQVCPDCGKPHTYELPDDFLERFHMGIRSNKAPDNIYQEFLIFGRCGDCQSKVFNCPNIFKGEDWGPVKGECNCCGAPIYKKDLDKKMCPSCRFPLEVVS